MLIDLLRPRWGGNADEKRIYNRELVRKKNFSLNQTAQKSGVKDFAKFHNSGYMGLYNGMTANDIYKMKNLNYRQDILDFMSSGELIDNLFRISQTEEALINNHVKNEPEANYIHYNIGRIVREAIIKSGGILPENYQVPKKSIDEIENKLNSLIHKNKYTYI